MGFLKSVIGPGKGVDAREADRLVRAGGLLLDVREPDEWRAGHAPGARHVALGNLKHSLGSMPRDRRIVVTCRSGRRSARATAS